MSLEKTRLNIGFIALSDCAPLVVAREMDFFAKHGLAVTLSREPSWANIRDKVALGVLDAAQMLAPMPLAITLGLGGVQKAMLTAFVLSLNGNAITLSPALYRRLREIDPACSPPLSAGVLKTALAQGHPAPVLASVFPFSMHQYQLRAWLADGGIDPDREARLTVVPPPQMVERLQAGLLDGFCVGAPWNTVAVAQGLGYTVITGADLMPACPEKVLGVTRAWAERHPQTHLALLQALSEAAQWLEANRTQAADLIAGPEYLDVPAEIARLSLQNQVLYSPGEAARKVADFHVFSHDQANRPSPAQAEFILSQMRRWGQIGDNPGNIAAEVYREDIYQAAML
jgi:nitrate/nitrite transport system substrate-binding protein